MITATWLLLNIKGAVEIIKVILFDVWLIASIIVWYAACRYRSKYIPSEEPEERQMEKVIMDLAFYVEWFAACSVGVGLGLIARWFAGICGYGGLLDLLSIVLIGVSIIAAIAGILYPIKEKIKKTIKKA